MHKRREFVLLVAIAAITLQTAPGAHASEVPEQAQVGGSSPAKSEGTRSIGPLQDLPPDRYAALRTQAFAEATAVIGPKLRNPKITASGIDTAVLAVLEEERSFVQARHGAGATPISHGSLLRHDVHADLPRQMPQSIPAHDRQVPWCKTPSIRSVNGKAAGAVFTPLLRHNHYVIEGCFFGAASGRVQLEPEARADFSSATPDPVNLPLDGTWSDGEIDAYLPSQLAGLVDMPVKLVIYPVGGGRIELPGCWFVAVRGEPKRLKAIPASWVNLQGPSTSTGVIRRLEYISPPSEGAGVPKDALGTSALVGRDDATPFGTGGDAYDFSHLNPGWVVESVQLHRYGVSCPGDVTHTESAGQWDTTWTSQGFTVSWASDTCVSSIPPAFPFTMSSSQYATTVWVIGPVGTEPLPNRF